MSYNSEDVIRQRKGAGQLSRLNRAYDQAMDADRNIRIAVRRSRREASGRRVWTKRRLKNLVSAIVFLALAVALIWQVRVNVEAFLDKLTTMTVSDIDREELDFPKVTFCPGFKPGAFKQSEDLINADAANKEINMADRLTVMTHEDLKLSLYARGRGQVNCFDYYGVDNATEDLITEWWNSITYNLDEFVNGAVLGNQHYNSNGGDDNILLELSPNQLLHEKSPVAIREISSPYGRCYEVSSELPFKTAEFVSLYFNLSAFGDKKIPIYVYEHGDIGLLSNYWVTEVFSVSVGRGETLDLPVVKEEVSYLSNDKIPCANKYDSVDNQDEDERQYHCIKKWAQEQYKKMNCTNVCSVPQSYLYTDGMDPPIPPCLTRDDGRCAIKELTRIYSAQDRTRVTGCLNACVRHSYRVSVRHEVSSWDGTGSGHESLSVATIFYPTSRIIRSVETRLIDNSAIVSALGGSLGLFLGFSFWDCFKNTIDKVDDFFKSRNPKNNFGSNSDSSDDDIGRRGSSSKMILLKTMVRKKKKNLTSKFVGEDPSEPPKIQRVRSFVDIQIT